MTSLFETFDPSDEHASCNAKVDRSKKHCGKVKFLMESFEKMGIKLPENYIKCVKCDEKRKSRGGFLFPAEEDGETGIHICQNGITDSGGGGQTAVDVTLAHELIHAYDQARAKVDWTDLKHHACSEIRASSMSGDCSFSREWNRQNGLYSGITGKHQECVKRRAALSVAMNPYCKNKEEAVKAVNSVFEHCYNDTMPFDKNP